MIGVLVLLVTVVALLPLANIILKIVKGKFNLDFYKKQGIKTRFFPKMGYLQMFDKYSFEENKTKSNLEYIKKLINEKDDKGIIAVNNFSTSSSNVFIYDSDLIKDFLMKEDHFAKSNAVKRSDYNRMGLFFENGEKFFQSKSLFTKIFRYEGMEKFVPAICEITHRCFNEFNEANGITKDKFTKVSLDKVFESVMIQITNLLIFGKAIYPAGSKPLEMHNLFYEIIDLITAARKNPLYYLAPYLAMKLKLIKEINELDKADEREKNMMKELLEERENNPVDGECVLDRIVQHNKECKQSGNSAEIMSVNEATGNYNLFLFAGSDTSQNSTKLALCHMADKPELKKIIDEINQEIYDGQGFTSQEVLNKSELLDRWAKETLRVHTPIGISTNRVALQDISIGKYHIQKGDSVSMFTGGLGFKDNFFKDPENFDIDRFKKENEKKLPRYQYLPFSVGKRVCLGKSLGEVMLRLLVTQFCRTYEFEKPSDVEYYNAMIMTIKPMNPWINVKLK